MLVYTSVYCDHRVSIGQCKRRHGILDTSYPLYLVQTQKVVVAAPVTTWLRKAMYMCVRHISRTQKDITILKGKVAHQSFLHEWCSSWQLAMCTV